MKNLITLLLTFCVLSSTSKSVYSQSISDFFIGKWNVQVIGTPNGDSQMVLVIQKNEGELIGTISAIEGESIKLTKIDENGAKATVYFNSQGYDVYLELVKKNENQVEGSLMGMFEAKGDRIFNGQALETQSQAGIKSDSDFFVGKCKLLVAGTPAGDVKAIVNL